MRPELVPSARQERSAPETAAISDAEIPAAPQPSPPVEPASYWRRAANRIAVQTLPARRLRHELETLQRQLADSRQDCRRLERRAERLRGERDGALADLERARARAVAAPAEPSAPEQRAPVTPPAAAEGETLSVAPGPAADGTQRDHQIAGLQSERDQLCSEVERLNTSLAALQQELAGARESSGKTAANSICASIF